MTKTAQQKTKYEPKHSPLITAYSARVAQLGSYFQRFPLVLVLCCQETITKQMDKRENCVRNGVSARQYGVSSGQSAESETVGIYCINSGLSAEFKKV